MTAKIAVLEWSLTVAVRVLDVTLAALRRVEGLLWHLLLRRRP